MQSHHYINTVTNVCLLQKQQLLVLLWQVLIQYLVCVRHLLKTEQQFADEGRRSVTFEKELGNINGHAVPNVLRAGRQTTSAFGMTLPDDAVELQIQARQYKKPANDKKADKGMFVVLNSLMEDLMPFAMRFYAHLEATA